MSCSFSNENSVCGATPYAPTELHVIPLEACSKDLTEYLTKLGVSGSRGVGTQITESEVILNRAGLHSLSKEERGRITVCPKHRYELTTHYQKLSSSCCYPSHRGEAKKLKNPRRVNKQVSEEIYEVYHVSVPIGSALCNTCRKGHSKSDEETKGKVENDENEGSALRKNEFSIKGKEENARNEGSTVKKDETPVKVYSVFDSNDLDFEENINLSFPNPSEFEYTLDSTVADNEGDDEDVSFWIDEEQRQHERRAVLNEAVGNISDGRVSPIASTLNSNWESISSTQKAYYLRKVRQVLSAVLTTIAPDQEEKVFDALKYSSDRDENGKYDDRKEVSKVELSILLGVYNEAESRQTRLQILSMFAKHFSKKELREMIPGLSNWQIDQARSHATEKGPGQPVVPVPIKRTRLDPAKTSHFVNFIARPNFLQDVAYGTKVLKLDSGEKITIPNVIRTMVPSRIIKQYIAYCQETVFEPASERTLYRIIEVCAASTQKSLQGLDYFLTEGAQAFEILHSVVTTLEEGGASPIWGKEAKGILKEAKRYLKTDFKSHVGPDERCADHCTRYSLSDPQNDVFAHQCDHTHDTSCISCCQLDEVLSDITNKINSPNLTLTDLQQSQVKFDMAHAVHAIASWKAHMLRTVNQEQAKEDALGAPNDKSVLVTMDWAMKYLPQRYREQMSDFYGKRGKSWHVACVILKSDENEYNVETVVHIFDSCTQDWFSVASILEHLLVSVKQEHPDVETAYLKSDNAGCYHNASLLLSLKSIGERTGISIRRYDFSDPQSGKDVCDRKIAPMKGHIQRWVNEKHDVVTAADMKEALESYGGVRGCRNAVAEVDLAKAAKTMEWKGISALFSFEFLVSGIRAWKAYAVGEGQMFLYDELGLSLQGPTDLCIVMPLTSLTPLSKPGLMVKKQPSNSFQDIFVCEEEGCVATFQTQADLYAHMDTGRHIRVTERETVYDLARKEWAEKGHRNTVVPRRQRGSAPTSKYPRNKEDPTKVAKEMRIARDGDGKLRFAPEEWRTAKQISSYFSRLAAAQRQNKAPTALIEEAENIDENDLEAWEAEKHLQELQTAVYEEVDLRHPIEYKGQDICGLVKRGMLKSKFKIAQLKELCDLYGIEIDGSIARKDSYVRPIEHLVKTCSCSKE
ncbi:hypothetical protein ACROYT_G024870 [Oculina patagonica]